MLNKQFNNLSYIYNINPYGVIIQKIENKLQYKSLNVSLVYHAIKRTCRPLDPPRDLRLPLTQAASVSWFPGVILKGMPQRW